MPPIPALRRRLLAHTLANQVNIRPLKPKQVPPHSLPRTCPRFCSSFCAMCPHETCSQQLCVREVSRSSPQTVLGAGAGARPVPLLGTAVECMEGLLPWCPAAGKWGFGAWRSRCTGVGAPSAALWGSIKSLIPSKPEKEPGSSFSCMGRGQFVVFLWLSLCRGCLLCKRRAAKKWMAKPPETAVSVPMGMHEKRGAGWIRSEKTCRFYEAPVPERVLKGADLSIPPSISPLPSLKMAWKCSLPWGTHWKASDPFQMLRSRDHSGPTNSNRSHWSPGLAAHAVLQHE